MRLIKLILSIFCFGPNEFWQLFTPARPMRESTESVFPCLIRETDPGGWTCRDPSTHPRPRSFTAPRVGLTCGCPDIGRLCGTQPSSPGVANSLWQAGWLSVAMAMAPVTNGSGSGLLGPHPLELLPGEDRIGDHRGLTASVNTKPPKKLLVTSKGIATSNI